MSDEHRIMNANDAWSVLASSLEPLPPPAGARDRLLDAIARAAPYRTLLPGFAAVFDLTESRVHELLARMEDPRAWTPGVGGVTAFLDFQAGPRLAPAHCGIARMKNGALVPRHRHRAREITFVLRGGLVDTDGNTYRAGQVLEAPTGSAHSLRVIGEPDALLAVLLAEVEIDGPP
jgi:quercetin dioxygenase-like cupin family protein